MLLQYFPNPFIPATTITPGVTVGIAGGSGRMHTHKLVLMT
jgi:hypothetical protein